MAEGFGNGTVMTENPLAPLEVVRVNSQDQDPAIDTEQSKIADYIRTRQIQYLVPLPGKKFVVFVVKRLPALYLCEFIDAVAEGNKSAKRAIAFLSACHEIRDDSKPTPLVTSPANALEGAPYRCTKAMHGVQYAPPEYAQEVADRYGLETIQEIGQVALSFAGLRRGAVGPFAYWG